MEELNHEPTAQSCIGEPLDQEYHDSKPCTMPYIRPLGDVSPLQPEPLIITMDICIPFCSEFDGDLNGVADWRVTCGSCH